MVGLALNTADAGELVAALFDLAPCPVWIHEAESLELLYFNPAARKRLGLAPDDRKTSVLRILPEWSEHLPFSADRRHHRLYTVDGAALEVELSARPVTVARR